jgi:hypothetical protein
MELPISWMDLIKRCSMRRRLDIGSPLDSCIPKVPRVGAFQPLVSWRWWTSRMRRRMCLAGRSSLSILMRRERFYPRQTRVSSTTHIMNVQAPWPLSQCANVPIAMGEMMSCSLAVLSIVSGSTMETVAQGIEEAGRSEKIRQVVVVSISRWGHAESVNNVRRCTVDSDGETLGDVLTVH